MLYLMTRLIVILGVFIYPAFVSIAETPDPLPEFHIYSDGKVHIISAKVERVHAANYYSISVWGLKWLVVADEYAKLESAYGESIKPEEVKVGHLLEVRGRPVLKEQGLIDAAYLRDISIKTGTPPAVASIILSPSQTPQFFNTTPPPSTSSGQAPSSPPTVSPPSSPTPIKGPLTQSLSKGMRGGEVIILQEFLQKNNWGIPNDGPVTGYFGKVTEKAVTNFQKTNNLEPVGFVGPLTRTLINSLLEK